MKTKGDDMSRFSVEFEIANNEDLIRAKVGDLDRAKVRRKVVANSVRMARRPEHLRLAGRTNC